MNDKEIETGQYIEICGYCGQEFDARFLDQVLYHAFAPHKLRIATGNIGVKKDKDGDA